MNGVNTARLETLCEPGGVCISRAANDQIRDKLSIAFADLGEQAVKIVSLRLMGSAQSEPRGPHDHEDARTWDARLCVVRR